MLKKNKIIFECPEKYEGVFEQPKPASKCVPEWYKKMDVDIHKNVRFDEVGKPRRDQTIKACIPVRDYITAGYIIPLNCDLVFNNNTLIPALSSELISAHSKEQVEGSNIKLNGKDSVLKYTTSWKIITPKGYSCLFFKPYFTDTKGIDIIPAIVDTDKYHMPNFPFTFDPTRYKDGDVIPKGTPLIQVFPFKRENWQIKNLFTDGYTFMRESLKINTFLRNGYRTVFHSKKKFY